jgi:NADP-dependent 3-hydroxy acid dehydrogenase YdfG/acyl carrier protein
VELALRAGEAAGCGRLAELTLEVPLVLPTHGGVQVQVVVGAEQEGGRRAVAVYARPEADETWTRHATGLLQAGGAGAGGAAALQGGGGGELFERLAGPWPPAGAAGVDTAGVYELFAGAGFAYGPTFQGLRRAWREGGQVFAEVALPEAARGQAGAFGVHPALLDAALHAAVFAGLELAGAGRLPFSFSDVAVQACGAAELRVCLERTGREELAVAVADPSGAPVASVGALALRPLAPQGLAAAGDGVLLTLDWTEVTEAAGAGPGAGVGPGQWALVARPGLPTSLASGGPDAPGELDTPGTPYTQDGPAVYADLGALGAAVEAGGAGSRATREAMAGVLVPQVVLVAAGDPERAGVVGSTHALVGWVLGQLQQWLGAEHLAGGRLVVWTRGAVAAGPGEAVADLAAAAVWGLVRSAQTENPGRIVLLDTELDAGLDAGVLARVLASGEPQLVLRGGGLRAARLTRLVPADGTSTGAHAPASAVDGRGTVLLTGGTGGLGGQLARHLVAAYGVRHLVLASRRGQQAEGVAELVAELTGLGATVTVAACDVGNRHALAGLLAGIPAEHPLVGVVHAAGVLDDGVIGSLSVGQVERVLAPKVDAAWHLHELTAGADLAWFVVFSSLAGVLGGAGQGNYAAANAFLDALVLERRSLGLAGVSMAWGPWTPEVGLLGSLSAVDVRRIARSGMPALSVRQGLELFDRALQAGRPVLGLTRLHMSALRAQPELPALWRVLAGGGLRRAAAGAPLGSDGFAQRLAGVPAAERERFLVELVAGNAAVVLGHASGEQVSATEAFREAGFDSLTAVELRNRLQAATGVSLPATVVFDYPTPARLAEYLGALFGRSQEPEVEIRKTIDSIPLARLREAGLLDILLALADGTGKPDIGQQADEAALLTADSDDLIRIVLGTTESRS